MTGSQRFEWDRVIMLMLITAYGPYPPTSSNSNLIRTVGTDAY